MLDVLIVSDKGEGFGLAKRLATEGCYVKFSTETGRVGEAFSNPKKVDDFEELVKKADVVFDFSGGRRTAGLSDMGRYTVGTSSLYRSMKSEVYTAEVAKLAGIGLSEADAEGEDGVSVLRWFNGDKFVGDYVYVKVYRRMLPGDVGLLTKGVGVAATTFSASRYAKHFDAVLGLLKKTQFFGPFGFKLGLHKAVGFELGVRAAVCYVYSELLTTSFANALKQLITGSEVQTKSAFACGISVSAPPYPFTTQEGEGGVRVINLSSDIEKHFFVEDVRSPDIYTGSYGVVGWATAYGEDVREARRRCLRTINNVVLARELQYRKDVGENADVLLKEVSNAVA